MKNSDLLRTAISNTFQSKTRTILTIMSIFIGAFTLTITSGLGTGINNYIDDTISSIGAVDTMTVTKSPEWDGPGGGGPNQDEGPEEYDPNLVETQAGGMQVQALTADDIATIESVDGVLRVEPQRSISPDFIEADGSPQFVLTVSSLVGSQGTTLATGAEPNNATTDFEVAIPVAYVEPLGFATNDDAIGATVTIGITDAVGTSHEFDATIVGVAEDALASPTAASVLVNDSFQDALFEAQNTGVPEGTEVVYASATAWFDVDSTEEELAALKTALEDEGFSGSTTTDTLGSITAVVDAIVLVLNGFAVIALIAAAFGIVNTLYMSVQERTREIGLMKAMGLGSGRVFGLFSMEAVFIGFLGSALGVLVAMAAGSGLSTILAGSLLTGLPGLTLIAFSWTSIGLIFALVMGIAFMAGTLPATRAAGADPVDSLRYE